MMKKQFLCSSFSFPLAQIWMARYEAMIGYNVHSIEIVRMGNWSKLNREREGACPEHWTLNKETKLESYINTDQAEYEHSALHTNFLSQTFVKEKYFFSIFCHRKLLSKLCCYKYKCAHCSWGIINCLVLFYKIRIDSEWWRCIQTEHSLYNGKAIPPQNNIFPHKKIECG